MFDAANFRLIFSFVTLTGPVRTVIIPWTRSDVQDQSPTQPSTLRSGVPPGQTLSRSCHPFVMYTSFESFSRSSNSLLTRVQIIPDRLHDEIESNPYGTTSSQQSPTTATTPTPQATQGAMRRAMMPSLSEGFDDFTGHSTGFAQSQKLQVERPLDQMPGVPSQLSELPPAHHVQAEFGRHSQQYGVQRTNSNLPSIRDIHDHRENTAHGYSSPYDMSMYSYGDGHGLGPSNGFSIESGHQARRPMPAYDSGRQVHQNYAHLNGHNTLAAIDQGKHIRGTYENSRGHTPYPVSYVDSDYPQHLSNGSAYANLAALGDMGDRSRIITKRRGNLPKPITDILRAWFYEHLDHPYPSEEDKQMFIARTGLSMSQVRPVLEPLYFRTFDSYCGVD